MHDWINDACYTAMITSLKAKRDAYAMNKLSHRTRVALVALLSIASPLLSSIPIIRLHGRAANTNSCSGCTIWP